MPRLRYHARARMLDDLQLNGTYPVHFLRRSRSRDIEIWREPITAQTRLMIMLSGDYPQLSDITLWCSAIARHTDDGRRCGEVSYKAP
ncbi:hypothetical protein ASG54_22665 [Aureimonas sp. Leaf460]|nr:hypothetical protein ASG54_22665 [Aureimonas sp. Leaf460]